MASPNPNVKRTYETIDMACLESTGYKSESGHEAFYCPFCVVKRGPDHPSKGRLYYTDQKKMGICFQCNTVVYPEGAFVDESESELFYAIGALRDKLERKVGINAMPEIKYDFEPLNDELKIYLRDERHPLTLPLIDILHLDGFYGYKDKGIVFPFFERGKIIKFQVRFTKPKEMKDPKTGKVRKMKYYTSPGPKPLYSPTHVLMNYKLLREDTVTICEGSFDALALLILGYPNPLAVLGSSITPMQIMQLRGLLPSNAFICMDEKSISYAIRDQLRGTVPSLSDFLIQDFGGSDPEEYLKSQLRDENQLAGYLDNIRGIRRHFSGLKVA